MATDAAVRWEDCALDRGAQVVAADCTLRDVSEGNAVSIAHPATIEAVDEMTIYERCPYFMLSPPALCVGRIEQSPGRRLVCVR